MNLAPSRYAPPFIYSLSFLCFIFFLFKSFYICILDIFLLSCALSNTNFWEYYRWSLGSPSNHSLSLRIYPVKISFWKFRALFIPSRCGYKEKLPRKRSRMKALGSQTMNEKKRVQKRFRFIFHCFAFPLQFRLAGI